MDISLTFWHTGIPMINGVAQGSIFATVMPLLTPETAEFVVEIAAEGAVGLTADSLRNAGTCGGAAPPSPTAGGGSSVPVDTIGNANSAALAQPVTDPSLLQQRLRGLTIRLETLIQAPITISDSGEPSLIPPISNTLFFGTCCWPGTVMATTITVLTSSVGTPCVGGCCYPVSILTCTSSAYQDFYCNLGPFTTGCVTAPTLPLVRAPLISGLCP